MMTGTARKTTDAFNNKAKRQYHSKQWWANHYQAWQGSGLTKKQYCVNHGITPSSFFNWVSKFEKSSISQNSVSASERFIRADVIPDCEPTQALSLALGDIRVYFDRGVSSSEINGWITALRSSQC